MNQNTPLPPSSETARALQKFIQWLLADPANQKAFNNSVNQVAKGEAGELPPEMIGPARLFIERVKIVQMLGTLRQKAQSAADLLADPEAVTDDPIQLARAKMIMNEVTDLLLDWREPYRTEFLKLLHPVREKLSED